MEINPSFVYFPERMKDILEEPNPCNHLVKIISNEDFDKHFGMIAINSDKITLNQGR